MKDTLLKKICARTIGSLMVLGLLLTLNGCGKKSYYVPAPQASHESRPGEPSHAPSSPPAASAPSTSPSRTKARVAEKCLTNLDAPKTIVHEVAPLETIWRLSKMYDVPPEAIYSANCLKPGDPIRIGQKLSIPNAKVMRHVISLYPNSQWKYVVIHHTATDIGKASLINQNHFDRGFWHGLGYHFLIDNGTLGKGDGQIEVAPRWIKQQSGAHCKAGGMNEKGIGIALVGNFSQDTPTPNQLDSLAYLLKTLCAYYKISPYRIIGHRDVEGANTECPGNRFPWPTVRQCLSTF